MIDPAFFSHSPGSARPADVPLAARIDEVERELTGRRGFYPRLVAGGRMTELDAGHEIAAFEAIVRDLRARQRQDETGAWVKPLCGIAWDAKVKALRREIAIRRNAYPRRVEAGRLTADDARHQLERIEAVHWMYWGEMFCWDDPAGAAAIWSPADPRYHTPAARAGRQAVRAHAALLDQARSQERAAA